jgi:diaminopimelate epimerase
MHGLGNDFVILDLRGGLAPPTPALARAIADRRRGVGFDQLITIEDAQEPQSAAYMGIYNPDGSRSGACGNATRCVAHILMNEADSDALTLRTDFGLLACQSAAGGLVRVNMGSPKLDWQDIPLADASDTVRIDVKLGPIDNPSLWGPGAVNMGNPHAVFFVDDADAVSVDGLGPMIENHPMFPERTNVEFCHVIDRGRIRMRVWERGAGITQACGSGACAAVVAGVRRGLIDRKCIVDLDGGPLTIEWDAHDDVYMTGPVALSYTGEIGPDILAQAAREDRAA